MKIMNSSNADTHKQGSDAIVEQASPKSYELESIKSYGSSSYINVEAKYKTEVHKQIIKANSVELTLNKVEVYQDESLEETIRLDHKHLSDSIGPHLKDGFSQREETPANIKKMMQGDLRASDFEMLNSIQSGNKLMRF